MNLKNRIFAVLVLGILAGCNRSYSSKYFSFPPSSAPHETNWTQQGQVVVWSPWGKKNTDRGTRKVEINVIDKQRNSLLADSLTIESAAVETIVQWDRFEELTIELFEKGNPYANDTYNKELLLRGKRPLAKMTYIWENGKYKKRASPNQAL